MQQLEHHQVNKDKQKFPIIILLHDIERPANVGSIFRLADGLGVEKLILSGSTIQPPNRKINKTARSTEQSVLFEYVTDYLTIIEMYKKKNYAIVSLELTDKSKTIADFQLNRNNGVFLILGSESKGVNPELLALSHQVIHIPMYGINSSLNVASAAAIAIYELTKKLLHQDSTCSQHSGTD